jgi:N-acetylglutamate synthase
VLDVDDLGHRVVVRHVIGMRDGRPLMTDVLGELSDLGDETLTVASRTGPVIVELRNVVAAKRIPPRPTRKGRAR